MIAGKRLLRAEPSVRVLAKLWRVSWLYVLLISALDHTEACRLTHDLIFDDTVVWDMPPKHSPGDRTRIPCVDNGPSQRDPR